MKFADPQPVTCPNCQARSPQRVADLLRLQALCPECGCSLNETGREMRRLLDDWGRFVLTTELAMVLEKRLSPAFEDRELDQVQTLRDLVGLVEHRLPQGPGATEQAIATVASAIRELLQSGETERDAGEPEAPINFDAPLLDAVNPHRW